MDYLALEGQALFDVLGDNSDKWAEAFCQYAQAQGHTMSPEGMKMWFGAAIDHAYAVRMAHTIDLIESINVGRAYEQPAYNTNALQVSGE